MAVGGTLSTFVYGLQMWLGRKLSPNKIATRRYEVSLWYIVNGHKYVYCLVCCQLFFPKQNDFFTGMTKKNVLRGHDERAEKVWFTCRYSQKGDGPIFLMKVVLC